MIRVPSRPLIRALALALIGCACASTADDRPSSERVAVARASDPGPGQAPAAEAKDAAKEAEQKADELRKKKHELEYAQIGLEIARLDAQANEIDTRRAIEDAERALALAGRDLDNFQKVVRELETSERALELDRARQNVHESEQELAELEAMYQNEQFAGTTKELVLTRGRSRLEMSKRAYAHAQRRAAQLKDFDHPRREHELAVALEKAEKSLLEAKAKEQRAAVQRRLDAMKAEHAVDDAERAVAKLESELATAAQKPVAAH